MTSDESPDPAQRHICWQCVEERYLSNKIQQTGVTHLCSYCQNTQATFSIQEMADAIDRAFADFYERTSNEPWEREGLPVLDTIADAAKIDVLPAEDIRRILGERHFDVETDRFEEECPFSEDSHYDLRFIDPGRFDSEWMRFETELKTQSRYFSRTAESILASIFSDIENLRTKSGDCVVVSAGPDGGISTIHRARVFAGPESELEEALCAPWKHLGTPPSNAARAGRMNAHGIAVFYGALNPETARAEVRPPVGSKVAIAEFKIIRPLRLLDLAALRKIDSDGSIFDPDTLPTQQRAGFLATLSQLLSAPVMPGDEASEYLTTQAVADYLANVADLDGIVFPSVQQAGNASNVVLFNKAARVKEVAPRESFGALLESQDAEGVHPDYCVWKREQPPATVQKTSDRDTLTFFSSRVDPDLRELALEIQLESIKIHHVTEARYRADEHPVRWLTR